MKRPNIANEQRKKIITPRNHKAIFQV